MWIEPRPLYTDKAGFNADHDHRVSDPDGSGWALQESQPRPH